MTVSALVIFLGFPLASQGQWFQSDIPEHPSEVSEIVFETETWIRRNPRDNSFLIFLTGETGPDGGPGFSQISVENVKFGVDHVLNIDIHRQLERKFRDYAAENGYRVQDLEGNGVRYLRIETDEPGKVAQEVLRQVHGMDEASEIIVFGEVEDGT